MSYNVPNWGFIYGNSTIYVGYGWGQQDYGAQYAQGSPQYSGAILVSEGHLKEIDSQGNIWYGFTMTNNGSATWYTLEGGGLT